MNRFAVILVAALGLIGASHVRAAVTVSEVGKDKVDATVTVKGSVESFRASRSEKAPNSFFLKDATGSIRVAIWPDVFDSIQGKEKIANGAGLTVTAKVTEFRDKLELHPAQASDVVVDSAGKPAASPDTGSSSGTLDIPAKQIGDVVVLTGEVQSFSASRNEKAPASFMLKHATGTTRVVVWPDTFASVPEHEKIARGASVRVEAKVAEYRNARELHVEKPEGLKLVSEAPVATGVSKPVPIAELTSERAKQTFTIVGNVVSARRPSIDTAPFVVKVADASGSIDVVFWMQTADQLTTGQKVEKGDKVQITGELGEHRGTLQLRVEDPKGIVTERSHPDLFRDAVETSASQVSAPVAARSIKLADMASGKLGERVRVSAQVVSLEEVFGGRKVVLKDDSGTATLLLWDTAHGLKPSVRNIAPADRIVTEGTIADLDRSGARALVTQRPEDIVELQPNQQFLTPKN
jgi:DNA/RNA endonuclease YhcR with UshA esterase domain